MAIIFINICASRYGFMNKEFVKKVRKVFIIKLQC